MRITAVLAAGVVLALSHPIARADVDIASAEERALLLELFTSEGCSSCPPADRWVSGLKDDPRLWNRIVPVAFHVDYWDYIGWPDRFASREHSRRQQSHKRYGHISNVYTPGFVVGGQEWRAWFRSHDLKLGAPARVGTLRVNVTGDRVEAGFTPAIDLPDRLELHVAVLGFDLSTAVEAGENHGRTLDHDFVVLGHRRLTMDGAGDTYRARGAAPEAIVDAPRTAIAAWVSPAGDTFPIQAAGGWVK